MFTLRPMSFYEFVHANQEQMLLDYLEKLRPHTPVPKIFEDKLVTLLNTYYITGGMPEVVAAWIKTRDVSEVERIQDGILNYLCLMSDCYEKWHGSLHHLSWRNPLFIQSSRVPWQKTMY